MEAIIKYSRLIEDDGGFDQLRNDLKKLGTDIKKMAEELQGVITLVDPSDTKQLEKLQNEVEKVKKAKQELADATEMLDKTEEEYKKNINEQIKIQSNRDKALKKNTDALDDLYISMEQHRLALKTITELEKKGEISIEEATKARGRGKLMMKQVADEMRKLEKEILESNKLSKQEKELLEAKLVVEKKQIDTIAQIQERMKALRVVVKNTNITTAEGREQVRLMNQEIDELSDTLEENSDTYIRNKINIGNYKESIIEALEETGLLSTGIGFLDNIGNKLIGTLRDMTKKTEENTEAMDRNAQSVTRFGKSLRFLANVGKATGILLLISVLASIFSIFKQGRAGVVKTQQAMAVFNVTIKVLINTLADLGKAFIQWLKTFSYTFENLGLWIDRAGLKMEKFFTVGSKDRAKLQADIDAITKKIEANSKANEKESAQAWKVIGEQISGFSKRVEDAKKSITTSMNGIIQAFVIGDKIKKAELELIDLRKEMQRLEIASDDSTTGMLDMLQATEELGKVSDKVFQKEIDIAKMQLQMANVKAKADLEASGMRVRSMEVENGNLQTQIDFAKQLLALNQSLDVTKNPLDNDLLDEQQEALKTLLEKQNEYSAFTIELAKKEREIKRDLFEQDLDLLIDLIDKQKSASEKYVGDVTNNFKMRMNEAENFFKKFAKTTQQELDLFTRTAKDQGLDLDFKINWNDDGTYDVFVNDQKLALDNIVELNRQLQGTKLSEIAINRFREFVVETDSAVLDFKDINKELTEINFKLREISGETFIGEKELEIIRKINEQYESLAVNDNLTTKQKDAIRKKIEELEKQKEDIQNQSDEDRLRNRLKFIDEELALLDFQFEQERSKILEKLQDEKRIYEKLGLKDKVAEKEREIAEIYALEKEGSEKEKELLKERNDIELQLEDKRFQKVKKNIEDLLNQKSKWEKFASELKEIFGAILDKFVEVSQKQLSEAEKRVDKQEEMTDKQRERAEQGLENTLAFEQKELAKREAEKIKAEKKLERAEKLKALWTSYTNNASNKDEKNPVLKTLRDFAILEAFSASFGEGGLAEDVLTKVPTDGKGITKGRSHRGRNGGIPVLIEGNEGFFSGAEVRNLGKENFYAIKEMAGRGPLTENMFKSQREGFVKVVEDNHENNRMINEIVLLRETIKNKKETDIDVPEVVDGILKFTETIREGNKTIKNHFRIPKRRL